MGSSFSRARGGSFPVILGLDFMGRTRMMVDVSAKQFKFGFAPHLTGECGSEQAETDGSHGLQSLISQGPRKINNPGDRLDSKTLAAEFPGLFSSILGTAKCVPYDIELVDDIPVRFPPIVVPYPRSRSLGKWCAKFSSKE